MIYTGLNRTGEILAVKAHGGYDVAEVYGSINYQNPIFYNRKTLTGTSPLTFRGLGQPLKDYHIFGETVQDGTPSPDYPVDVQGVGERTENLWDGSIYNYAYWTDGGRVSPNPDRYAIGIEVEGNKIYTISRNVGASSYFAYGFSDDTIENIENVSPHQTLDSGQKIAHINNSQGKKYLWFFFGAGMSTDIMIVEGSTAPSSYVPYGYKIPVTVGGATTPIYIGADPLYRIGEYADEIDFANQQIIRRIKKLVLDGTENWAYTLNSVYPGWCSLIKSGDFPLLGVAPISTAFKGNSGGQGTEDIWHQPFNSITVSERRNTSSTSYNICLRAFNSTDRIIPSTIKGYFENKNLTLLYVLDTPTTESVTIPTLSTIVGDNTLSVGTTVKPSAVSITGNIKPTGYGQLLDVNDVDIQDSTGEPVYIQG